MAFLDTLKKLLQGAQVGAQNSIAKWAQNNPAAANTILKLPQTTLSRGSFSVQAPNVPKIVSQAPVIRDIIAKDTQLQKNPVYKVATAVPRFVGQGFADMGKQAWDAGANVPLTFANRDSNALQKTKELALGTALPMTALLASGKIASKILPNPAINKVINTASGPVVTSMNSVGKQILRAAGQGAIENAMFNAGARSGQGTMKGEGLKKILENIVKSTPEAAGAGAVLSGGLKGMELNSLGKKMFGPKPELVRAESSIEIPGQQELFKKEVKKGYVPPKQKKDIPPRQFNKKAYQVGESGQAALDQAQIESAAQVNKLTGDTLTHKEVMQGVNETTPVLKGPVTKEQTKAYEQSFQRTQEILADMSRKGKVTPEFKNLFSTIQSHKTDIGRKLEFQKNPVNPKGPGDPFMTQVFTQLKTHLGDKFDSVWQAAQNVDFKDEEQVRNFYRSFVKPNIGDWNTKLRYSSMLSSPATSINNIESNLQGTGVLAPVEKTVLGGIDWLSNKVLGTERKNFVGEGAEYAKGYWNLGNIKKATDRFVLSMKSGKPAPGDVYTPKLTESGTMGRKVENTLDFFPKFLKAQDEFFQSLTEGALEKSNAYKMKKGVEMGDSALAGYSEARKRLFNAEFGLKEEGPVLKAIEFIPQKIQEARRSTNPIVSTIANLTFPFVRIPANILKQGVEYSPFGISTMLGASNKKEQLAKAVVGSTIFTMASLLTSSDRITWAEPTSEAQRTAFRAAGIQPYSVKIGDKWVSYAKLHPVIGMNLALAAAMKNAYDNGTVDQSDADKIIGGAAKWLNFFADQSYIKNMGDLVAAGKGDTYGVSKFFSNYPLQEIPFRAFFSWINRAVDPYYRDTSGGGEGMTKQLDGIMKQAMAQVPGLSGNLPQQLDAMGNPIEKTPGKLGGVPLSISNMLSPYQMKQEVPGNREIYDNMQNRLKKEKQEKAMLKTIQGGKGESIGSVSAKTNEEPKIGDTLLAMLQEKQAQESKVKTITDILTRSGQYKDIPNTQDKTNQLLKMNNFSSSDVSAAKDDILKKLDTSSTVQYIKSTPNVDFVDLYSKGILTTAVAREMERQRYIQDADALMKKLQSTDVYYQQSQARKSQASLFKKLASQQKRTMKSILSKRSKSFKVKKYKAIRMKKLKLPKISYKSKYKRIKL